ncbi:hypothetical protein C8F04DRAFT_1198978 [Mycena alexandri]|uniref:Uncharacterized protein n=1 Tax=Mycena alexandri TaxID=1745969 RepID=A0AAD6WRN5_9AGAR|nr:hypothetical protein C8F04DRAFT_1198978 [Mycena alexandri]
MTGPVYQNQHAGWAWPRGDQSPVYLGLEICAAAKATARGSSVVDLATDIPSSESVRWLQSSRNPILKLQKDRKRSRERFFLELQISTWKTVKSRSLRNEVRGDSTWLHAVPQNAGDTAPKKFSSSSEFRNRYLAQAPGRVEDHEPSSGLSVVRRSFGVGVAVQIQYLINALLRKSRRKESAEVQAPEHLRKEAAAVRVKVES